MKLWVIGILAFFLVGCTVLVAGLSERPVQNSSLTAPTEISNLPMTQPNKIETILEDYGPAPELTNEVWLNTKRPLRLSELRGKVVLLDMWTFG